MWKILLPAILLCVMYFISLGHNPLTQSGLNAADLPREYDGL